MARVVIYESVYAKKILTRIKLYVLAEDMEMIPTFAYSKNTKVGGKAHSSKAVKNSSKATSIVVFPVYEQLLQ